MPLNSLEWLDEVLAGAGTEVQPIADALKRATHILYDAFTPDADADLLVRQKARFVDRVLKHCYCQFLATSDQQTNALLAVGGFGRGELLPGSDIDLMLLLDKKPTREMEGNISALLTFLWDIGLEVGSSVRTVKDRVAPDHRQPVLV